MNIASQKITKAIRIVFCWGCVSFALNMAPIVQAQSGLPTLPYSSVHSKPFSTASAGGKDGSYVVVSYPADGTADSKPKQLRVFKKLRKLPSSPYQSARPTPSSQRIAPVPVTLSSPTIRPASVPTFSQPVASGNIVQASCSSCGGGSLLGHGGGGNGSCSAFGGGCPTGCCPGINCEPGDACCSTQCGQCCVPGRTKCCAYCYGKGPLGKLLCGLYYATQCPDPCYTPRWNPVANAGMFLVADARPISHMRIRYDGMFNMRTPDRNEYIMGRQDGAKRKTTTADLNEIHLYNEIAVGGFGFFVDLPFRSVEFNPSLQSGSGFGDMSVGTKSVLLDSELLLSTFQFTTYIPTGLRGKGLGTGHVSLEPALLFSLKLTPDVYLQFETAWWIPISGDSTYAGNIWHNHVSLNTVLWRFLTDSMLIGTLEGVAYHLFDGAYTNTQDLTVATNTSIYNAGGSIRWHWGERSDVGIGMLFAVTGSRYAGEHLRFEFRRRF